MPADLPKRSETADLPDPLVLERGRPLEAVEHCIYVASAGAGIRHRALAFYLQEVDCRALYQLRGFRTTAQYAATQFSIARREARDLLAVGRALLELPVIDQAFAAGEVCWSKVRELAKVASPQHEAKWLERAKALHIDELILDVRLAKPGEAPRDRDDRKGLPEPRLWIHMQVPPDVFAKWEQSKKKVSDESGRSLKESECFDAMCDLTLGHRGDSLIESGAPAYCVVMNDDAGVKTVETDDGPLPVDDTTAEMIACDCGCIHPNRSRAWQDARPPVTARQDAEQKTSDAEAGRRVPVALRRRVLARDGLRCRCCGSRHRKQIHHIIPVSKGGRTVLANLITLCRTCHSLIHAELLVIHGSWESGWRFVDREGRDLHGPGPSPAEAIGAMSQDDTVLAIRGPAAVEQVAAEAVVTLAGAPAEIDADWLHRHGHLLSFNDRRMMFELRPGLPAPVEQVEVGTMCQPRPTATLADLVGQEAVVGSLAMAVKVALDHDEPLGHVLLCGAPGLGKSTLAEAVAGELGTQVQRTTGTLLQCPAAMVLLLGKLARHDVLFIDEIHELPARVAEVLFEALTHKRVSLPVFSGSVVRTLVLRLPPFTLMGATTDEGALSQAFLSRFEHLEHLRFYNQRDLAEVIRRAAPLESITIDGAAAALLASVSRGTPREALRLFRQARGQALAAGCRRIDEPIAEAALARLDIDELGLGPRDRQYLEVLRSRGPGRPIGLCRVAAMIGASPRTLERLHEPYIFRLGLATTTPNGRVAITPPAAVREAG